MVRDTGDEGDTLLTDGALLLWACSSEVGRTSSNRERAMAIAATVPSMTRLASRDHRIDALAFFPSRVGPVDFLNLCAIRILPCARIPYGQFPLRCTNTYTTAAEFVANL